MKCKERRFRSRKVKTKHWLCAPDSIRGHDLPLQLINKKMSMAFKSDPPSPRLALLTTASFKSLSLCVCDFKKEFYFKTNQKLTKRLVIALNCFQEVKMCVILKSNFTLGKFSGSKSVCLILRSTFVSLKKKKRNVFRKCVCLCVIEFYDAILLLKKRKVKG